MEEILYSPHPPLDYTRLCPEMGRVGIGLAFDHPSMLAQWNLYWLSDPAVDDWLLDVAAWGELPLRNSNMYAACCESVASEQLLGGVPIGVLLRTLTPVDFVGRVRTFRHAHLKPYIADKKWVSTIEKRSQLYRGAVAVEGNVHAVNFGQRPVDRKVETAPESSATIMTLASKKTVQRVLP